MYVLSELKQYMMVKMSLEMQLLHKIDVHGLKMNQETCLIKNGLDTIRLGTEHIRVEIEHLRLEIEKIRLEHGQWKAMRDRLDKEGEL